jgi:hypothetical protein
MDTQSKIRENRLRRMADRQGLALERSRRRDPRAVDYGTYRLINPQQNALVYPSGLPYDYGASLDDIETFLTQD